MEDLLEIGITLLIVAITAFGSYLSGYNRGHLKGYLFWKEDVEFWRKKWRESDEMLDKYVKFYLENTETKPGK